MLTIVNQGKDKTSEERRIAICIFDDIAEHCRETALKYYDSYLPFLLEACNDECPDVRQVSPPFGLLYINVSNIASLYKNCVMCCLTKNKLNFFSGSGLWSWCMCRVWWICFQTPCWRSVAHTFAYVLCLTPLFYSVSLFYCRGTFKAKCRDNTSKCKEF